MYTQSMFEQKYEKRQKFSTEVIFTAVKNRCMLHGRVFVMATHLAHSRVSDQTAQSLIRLGKCQG